MLLQITLTSDNTLLTLFSRHFTVTTWIKLVTIILQYLCFVGSLPLPGNLTSAMTNYGLLLDSERTNLINEFNITITEAVEKAKDCYRCNYKCHFNTGSYGFAKHQYKRTW